MKKYILYTIIGSGLMFLAVSCKKTEHNGILGDNDVPPGQVKNVNVVNENGKARITYTLPPQEDLLYVKAVYDIGKDKKREVIASSYTNTMVLDGFGDELPHEVKLYAVNKSEAASEPVTITVTPQKAAFKLVFESLQAAPTFGGVRLTSTNTLGEDVVIVPLVDEYNTGEWENLDNFYTKNKNIVYNLRGLKPKETKFAFYVRDRWLNRSDTLYANITPYEENLLDKNLFAPLRLPNDAPIQYGTIELLWDKATNPSRWPSFYTVENASEPQSVTFSLGKEANLSRIVINPRREVGFYDKGNLRDFEVWASNNPSTDGDWSSWTKLITATVVKPSGSPKGTDTGVDEAYGIGGWSFDFPEGLPKYKYIRIRNLRNWNGSYFMQINQVSVWGVY